MLKLGMDKAHSPSPKCLTMLRLQSEIWHWLLYALLTWPNPGGGGGVKIVYDFWTIAFWFEMNKILFNQVVLNAFACAATPQWLG